MSILSRSTHAIALALLFSTTKAFTPHGHNSNNIIASASARSNHYLLRPLTASSSTDDKIIDNGKTTTTTTTTTSNHQEEEEECECEVLLLDHLNINHEKGQQDVLKAFYFDFLGCAIDPRKYENYIAGKKTLWANIGMHQFHLPEGKPSAQVFSGLITLLYSDFSKLMDRYNAYLDGDEPFIPLKETEFSIGMVDDMMLVTDPWGNQFCILQSDDPIEDRAAQVGSQPVLEGHDISEGLALEDLTVYLPHGSNLDGIGRFYEYVLGAPTVSELTDEDSISVAMGERQTLTFQYHPDGEEDGGVDVGLHTEFSYADEEDVDADLPVYPSNHGPHISLYVTNLSKAYVKAEELGVLYVNPRFTRRAYTKEQALDQCMFRIMDIYDPLDEEREVIVSLEHEVRSAKKLDGTKYKSCPLLVV